MIIDEVQKCPKLLDIAHLMIEGKGIKFALSGSSARKIKRGAANLLAGRAFVNNLHPFTHIEIGDSFSLSEALTFGSLPALLGHSTSEDKNAYL